MRIGVGLLDVGQPLCLFALPASPCESDKKDKCEFHLSLLSSIGPLPKALVVGMGIANANG